VHKGSTSCCTASGTRGNEENGIGKEKRAGAENTRPRTVDLVAPGVEFPPLPAMTKLFDTTCVNEARAQPGESVRTGVV
jgi:hypothetical protein